MLFGLNPVTVLYDPVFDRHQKHTKAWYHGASLTALAKLRAAHGYGLAAGSDGSCNAFVTRDGSLKVEDVFKPKRLREKLSGIPHAAQWDFVKECRLSGSKPPRKIPGLPSTKSKDKRNQPIGPAPVRELFVPGSLLFVGFVAKCLRLASRLRRFSR